jgi:hypothetical protein
MNQQFYSGVHPREMRTHDYTKTGKSMLMAALFTIAPTGNNSKCPPTDKGQTKHGK